MRGWRLVVVFSVVLGFLALGGPAIASPSVPGLPGVQYHACNPDSCVYLTVTRTPTFVKQVSGGGAVTGGNACLYGRLYINGIYRYRTSTGCRDLRVVLSAVWGLRRSFPHGTTFEVTFTTTRGTGRIYATPTVELP